MTDTHDSVTAWQQKNCGTFAHVLGQPLDELHRVCISVADSTLPRDPFNITDEEAAALVEDRSGYHLGYYAEPRLIYTDQAFYKGPFKASSRRTVHIGVDIFVPAGTQVHAPAEATVAAVAVAVPVDDEASCSRKDAGGIFPGGISFSIFSL